MLSEYDKYLMAGGYKGPWRLAVGVKNVRRRFIVADLRFIK
jgi:hypothetical protein